MPRRVHICALYPLLEFSCLERIFVLWSRSPCIKFVVLPNFALNLVGKRPFLSSNVQDLERTPLMYGIAIGKESTSSNVSYCFVNYAAELKDVKRYIYYATV